MSQKIIIDFSVKGEVLENSVVFENGPSIHLAIEAMDSAMQMFKKSILNKAEEQGVTDEGFNDWAVKTTVNELDKL